MGGGGGGFNPFGLFGGGGSRITYNVPQPAAPTPIDYDKMYDAATRSAIAQMREQEGQLQRLYPTLTGLQFGTVNELARGLDNAYLGTARNVVGQELGAASAPSWLESQIQQKAANNLARGPTSIQRMLRDSAQRELSLGAALSPEEQRAASQSARQAFAARGLGTGTGAASAELLNRDAYGRQRQNERRAFAQQADQYMLGQRAARLNEAMGANQVDLARRQRRLTLAGGYADLDPYARAINPAFQVGTTNTGQGLQSIGQTFGNALTASGNAASFNSNLQAGMYNTWQNNNAAIQAANMTGRAAQSAGFMNMLGGLGGGAMAMFSDKRMKKDIKQTGKDGVLGLKTYEFRFKGESKDAPKHTGFMAQEVQKVLPEAVEEVDYKGKKRLAIKPQVIGQALAAAIASQQDAMFEQGYTVGKGFGQ